MTDRLKNKVAIVTGAASGIGAASARLFASEGASVALADRDHEKMDETVREINDAGGQAIGIGTDVGNEASIQRMVEQTVEEFGKLHIMYANAGISGRFDLETVNAEDFDRVMHVNLRGPFLCAKYAVPKIADSGGGSVIFTASELALVGSPGASVYSASKAGLIGMARGLALDYADANIRFNCICPGAVDTPMLWGEEKGERDAIEADISSRMPLGRVGKPEEIARSALYLASDDSSFVTGHALVVDGGWTVR
ncbi:MAG: SDR family oxidoreductase [Sphaerobacteraceae bacterium]|nr:MAG: SDR family oxidoreductase [Sphaerobacteraceae bacterium]